MYKGGTLEVQTDPYNNAGTIIRTGLPVADNALLPNIIYPYLPSGNFIQNWKAQDIKNAPDIGALEAIVIFLAQSFSGTSSGGSTTSMFWRLSLYITVLGMMLSGFMTFKAVAGGKKGPGEAIVSLVLKYSICVMMFTMVCPNLPPMLIGLCNYVTKGIDGWFSHSNASGKQGADYLEATYNTKMTAGMAVANIILDKIGKALAKTPGDDAQLQKAIDAAMDEIDKDVDVITATGRDGEIKNGLDQVRNMFTKADARSINSAISHAAKLPATVVLERCETIVRKALKANAAKAAPEPMIEAILKAPQGVDISAISYPDRLIATYGYTAFCYLAMSIWGMGFASLAWVMLYSLPEEWNMGGILFSGIKGGLTIILTCILISVYMGAGLNFQRTKTEALTKTLPTTTQKAWAWIKDKIISTPGEVASIVGTPWRVMVAIKDLLLGNVGVGDIMAQAVGAFTGMTLEQFMIGLLILTAPAQAAMMVKGANGVGESAAKALNARGASSQGFPGELGIHGGSSGATLGSDMSAQSIMQHRGENRHMFNPTTPFQQQ